MKRHLFAELTEGFDALEQSRHGKLTLRSHPLNDAMPAPEVTAQDLFAIRERLNVSHAVFARYLRTTPRTLKNWEQGRSHPNAQATLLIQMVKQYPDTIERIKSL